MCGGIEQHAPPMRRSSSEEIGDLFTGQLGVHIFKELRILSDNPLYELRRFATQPKLFSNIAEIVAQKQTEFD